jgi:hypothetical protein
MALKSLSRSAYVLSANSVNVTAEKGKRKQVEERSILAVSTEGMNKASVVVTARAVTC